MISVRGDITVSQNTKEEILDAAKELLEAMLRMNRLELDQIISILFTATKDLDRAYPAAAARDMGLTSAGLMCAQEMNVTGSLEKCLRALLVADCDQRQDQA
ncbi:MAG: chorismate mutase, partial [Clostridiales bacterium]|nr:chorismate mutase [Clostridiales bacterium]